MLLFPYQCLRHFNSVGWSFAAQCCWPDACANQKSTTAATVHVSDAACLVIQNKSAVWCHNAVPAMLGSSTSLHNTLCLVQTSAGRRLTRSSLWWCSAHHFACCCQVPAVLLQPVRCLLQSADAMPTPAQKTCSTPICQPLCTLLDTYISPPQPTLAHCCCHS